MVAEGIAGVTKENNVIMVYFAGSYESIFDAHFSSFLAIII